MALLCLTLLTALLIAASASPSPAPTPVQLENRVTALPSGFPNPVACLDSTLATSRNDILNGGCKNLTLIFARGTFESGNMGGWVGPNFVAALVRKLGDAQVAVQGVNNYPADTAGFNAGGSATGSMNMAMLIGQTLTQCPNSKLLISGYSQGAQVAHNAAAMLNQAQTAFVNSAVLWGDPDNGYPFGSVPAYKVSTDCHLADDICLHGNVLLPTHMDYCLDVDTEAAFVVARSGLMTI